MTIATKPETGISGMPLEEIVLLPEWLQLTPKQKTFLELYIRTGVETGNYDPEAAVRAAYAATARPQNAKLLGYELLGHRKIRAILNLHFGKPPETEMDLLLSDLRKAIRRSLKSGEITVATQRALEFYERHAALALAVQPEKQEPQPKPKPQPAAAPKPSPIRFEVGQRVTQRDKDGVVHSGVVRAVDENGKPTAIETVE